MISTKEWLHRLAKKFILDKDPAQGRKLAEILGCSPDIISKQRNGQMELNSEQIKKISMFLDTPTIVISASVNYEKYMRQEKFDDAEEWERIFDFHTKKASPELHVSAEEIKLKKLSQTKTSNKEEIK